MEGDPDLLVAVHPTLGLDIGAIRFVHDTMIQARDKGCGVLLISAHVDEILEVSDRIVVIFEDRSRVRSPARIRSFPKSAWPWPASKVGDGT